MTANMLGRLTLRILDGITWGFSQAKCWRWTMMCGCSILS